MPRFFQLPNDRLINVKVRSFSAAALGTGIRQSALSRWPHLSTIFDHWRNAEQAAMLATRALCNKAIAAMSGASEPPTDAERLEVARLRGVARELFHEAMAAMGQAARGRVTERARPQA